MPHELNHALFPTPPHQTVRAAFPHTAFQPSSSTGFRSLRPARSRWYLVQLKGFVQITFTRLSVTKWVRVFNLAILYLPCLIKALLGFVSQPNHTKLFLALHVITLPLCIFDFTHMVCSNNRIPSCHCPKQFTLDNFMINSTVFVTWNGFIRIIERHFYE